MSQWFFDTFGEKDTAFLLGLRIQSRAPVGITADDLASAHDFIRFFGKRLVYVFVIEARTVHQPTLKGRRLSPRVSLCPSQSGDVPAHTSPASVAFFSLTDPPLLQKVEKVFWRGRPRPRRLTVGVDESKQDGAPGDDVYNLARARVSVRQGLAARVDGEKGARQALRPKHGEECFGLRGTGLFRRRSAHSLSLHGQELATKTGRSFSDVRKRLAARACCGEEPYQINKLDINKSDMERRNFRSGPRLFFERYMKHSPKRDIAKPSRQAPIGALEIKLAKPNKSRSSLAISDRYTLVQKRFLRQRSAPST